jgi:hypothetical protein
MKKTSLFSGEASQVHLARGNNPGVLIVYGDYEGLSLGKPLVYLVLPHSSSCKTYHPTAVNDELFGYLTVNPNIILAKIP